MLRVQWSRDRWRHVTPKGQSRSRYSAAMGQIPRSTERISSFDNKISLLYSRYGCKIRSWSFRFRQFGACQVNTVQISTLLYSCLLNKWTKFSTKIFAHFSDIVIYVLGILRFNLYRQYIVTGFLADPRHWAHRRSFVLQLSYFDDQTVHCLRSLDSVESKDAQQKFDYFNKLSASVPLFPEVSKFVER